MPKELLDGLDDIRLLGNDAAHIESRDYDNIGKEKEEVELAIDFTKEVLKAVLPIRPFFSPWAPTLGFDDGALGAVNYTVS